MYFLQLWNFVFVQEFDPNLLKQKSFYFVWSKIVMFSRLGGHWEDREDSHQGYQHDAIAFMFVSLRLEIYTILCIVEQSI